MLFKNRSRARPSIGPGDKEQHEQRQQRQQRERRKEHGRKLHPAAPSKHPLSTLPDPPCLALPLHTRGSIHFESAAGGEPRSPFGLSARKQLN